MKRKYTYKRKWSERNSWYREYKCITCGIALQGADSYTGVHSCHKCRNKR